MNHRNFVSLAQSKSGPRHRFLMAGSLAFALSMTLWVALAASTASASGQDARLDLNRASAEELTTLPGIGNSKAASIVEYRTEAGPFATIDELAEVKGIGPALIAKLRPLVRLGAGGDERAEKKLAPGVAPKSAKPRTPKSRAKDPAGSAKRASVPSKAAHSSK